MKCLAALLLVLCLPVLAEAQTPVPANTPFRVIADKNPPSDNATLYRCYVGPSATSLTMFAEVPAPPGNNPVECQHSGLPAGSFVVGMAAVNSFGEGAKATAAGTAGNLPGAPQNLRVVTVTVTVAVP